MTKLQYSAHKIVTSMAVLMVAAFAPAAFGQAKTLKAEVRAIKGSATYSTAGAPAKPVKVGMSIPANSTIQTGSESTVDLFLGPSAGVVRVAEKSTVSLTKLNQTQTGAENVVDVQMNLPEGDLYFNVNKLSQASRYEIKMPTGVAGIRGTKGRCHHRGAGDAKPAIVLLDGRLVFVHVPQGGEPKAYVMSAPPPVYFSAVDGVKEAPADLIREVNAEVERAGRPGGPGGPAPGQGAENNQPPVEPYISPNAPK